MHKHINQVTHLDCPTCKEAKLTLRQNRTAKTLFLGCQTYQTTKCPGSLPLNDELIIDIKKHWDALSEPRQLSLLDKGHQKVRIRLEYLVYDADGGYDIPLETGEAELSYDNLVLKLSDMSGIVIFEELLKKALQSIALDEE